MTRYDALTLPTHAPPSLVQPGALQQHPLFARTLTRLGRKVLSHDVTLGGAYMGHAQIVLRRFGPLRLAWLPRGPLWQPGLSRVDKAQSFARLQATLPRSTGWIINCENPDDPDWITSRRKLTLGRGQTRAHLPLFTDQQAQLDRMHGKWRNRLRHAQNGPLHIQNRAFDPLRDAPLLQEEMLQRGQKRYGGYPPGFTLMWARSNPNAARMFLATHGTETVAFMLLLLHAPTASYHIGWSGAAGRKHSAHNLLLWQAATWLARHGFQTLDLGTADPTRTPGLTRFKTGAGAQLHHLGPTCVTF